MKTFLFFITDRIDERTQIVIVKDEDFEHAVYRVVTKLNVNLEGTKMKGELVEGDFFVKEIGYENY